MKKEKKSNMSDLIIYNGLFPGIFKNKLLYIYLFVCLFIYYLFIYYLFI